MQTRGRQYNKEKVVPLLEKLLAELGTESFSTMGLLALEKRVRQLPHPDIYLPGKTVLREIINQFRYSRWPELKKPAAYRR